MEGLGEAAAEPKELAAKLRGHVATSPEIHTLCRDLQVRRATEGPRQQHGTALGLRTAWVARARGLCMNIDAIRRAADLWRWNAPTRDADKVARRACPCLCSRLLLLLLL